MSTIERLRADIDGGRTKDKVAGSDPAAVPLGADDEAAGTPPSKEAVQMARANEVSREVKTDDDGGVGTYAVVITGIGLIIIGAVTYLLR
jgi:hypothetical protein